MSKESGEGKWFIECFDGRVVVFISAEDRKILAVLSSAIFEGACDWRGSFLSSGLDAHLRSPPTQRSARRGLISDLLPFKRLWYDVPGHAIGWRLAPDKAANIVAYSAQAQA